MYNVYVSGALTNVDNLKRCQELYEEIGLLCQKLGLQAYIPHLHTDPINHPDISPYDVFKKDKYEISLSDLVIAYLGFPSVGVGMELAYAEVNKIPIIILYEESKQISRFPRGIPTVIAEIQFYDREDVLRKLNQVLVKWKIDMDMSVASKNT
ncbi:XRE family transcriptional regulator [Scytonema sp. NUACC26]|uniref:XRE family transcriptional regulator n=1 Tax=Scytonema sp. NUACC26 TaxID=3140176 RepID=UPI0034DBC62B